MLATERQAVAYEAATRLRGAKAAAQELGVSDTSLYALVKEYCARTDAPYPAGMIRRAHGSTPRPKMTERMDRIEADLVAITGGIAALEKAAAAILAEVKELNARQPILLVAQPTHRRVKDGGIGGRKERQESGLG
jgi:hypothetical protein